MLGLTTPASLFQQMAGVQQILTASADLRMVLVHPGLDQIWEERGAFIKRDAE